MRGDAKRRQNGDAGGRAAQKDPSVLARKRAFMMLERHRESLAAQFSRHARARRRYEDLCLVKMLTRLQRDSLSQPTSAGYGTPPDGNGIEPLEHSVADWASPWGASCLLQLQADLNLFDRNLKSSRRWLSATSQRGAEARAGERFVAVMARMGKKFGVAEFALPRWATSSTQPTSRKPAPYRAAPGRDEPRAAPGGRLDLNAATFEELRSLELSRTQSHRLLAYRKRFHGFQSIDQLDAVPGFPKRVRDRLRDQLTV
jgi:DNA uptake protein ComE-like DNA-binding protein